MAPVVSFIAPSAGPDILDFFSNSTSLFFEWEPPNEYVRNGIIREYYAIVEEEITGRSWTYRTYNTHIIARNLHPYYVYVCRVHAITVAMGPPSDSVDILTEEAGKLLTVYS